LLETLPGSTGFHPDQIAGLSSTDWHEFQIDDRDPATVTEDLVAYCQPIVAGIIVVTTFQSWRPDVGPFFVGASGFPDFATAYSEAYDDALVAGDTVLVSAYTGIVVVVHHNGLIAAVRGSATQASIGG